MSEVFAGALGCFLGVALCIFILWVIPGEQIILAAMMGAVMGGGGAILGMAVFRRQ